MGILVWIVGSGFAMSMIALVGSLTLVLRQSTLEKILLPLVAFAAGSLIGGAVFHMLPASVEQMGNTLPVYGWLMSGFLLFLALEQFLNWHHSHSHSDVRQPLTYLILIADGLHNFVGGLFVSAAFLVDIRLGMTAWLAAAAHEVPQELGDFAVLIHGGWQRGSALIYNFLSGLTFLVGGLTAYGLSARIDVDFLIPFAAGNFLYIGAADLIPEIKESYELRKNLLHFSFFALGLALLLAIRLAFGQ